MTASPHIQVHPVSLSPNVLLLPSHESALNSWWQDHLNLRAIPPGTSYLSLSTSLCHSDLEWSQPDTIARGGMRKELCEVLNVTVSSTRDTMGIKVFFDFWKVSTNQTQCGETRQAILWYNIIARGGWGNKGKSLIEIVQQKAVNTSWIQWRLYGMIHWAKAKGTRVKEKIRFHEKSVRNVTLCHETQRWRCDINIMPELDGGR